MRNILRTTTFDERLAQVRRRRRAVTTRTTLTVLGWLFAGLVALAIALAAMTNS